MPVKLYAKKFDHPIYGTMYSAIGIDQNPRTVKELCEHIEENPEAFEKLKNIRQRTLELQEQLVSELSDVIMDFGLRLTELANDKDKYTEDHFEVEISALGLVGAMTDKALNEVREKHCEGMAKTLMKAQDHAAKISILKYVDPAGYKKYLTECEEKLKNQKESCNVDKAFTEENSPSELDIDPATHPAYNGTCAKEISFTEFLDMLGVRDKK